MRYKNVNIDGADKMSYRELVDAVRVELIKKYGDQPDIADIAVEMVTTDEDVIWS